MALYRLFFFDPENHIKSLREISAETDGEAVALVLPYPDGQHMELWLEARRVAIFEPVAA